MSCSHYSNGPDWERRIALHASGDLSPEEAAEVERRLAECPECAAVSQIYRDQLRMLGAAHEETIAPAHCAAVRARVLAEVERGRSRAWRWAWVGAGAVAVVIAFALFPDGVRAPQRVVGPDPRIASPGNMASAGVDREVRKSPAQAGDSTLKRAPRGPGGSVAEARTSAKREEQSVAVRVRADEAAGQLEPGNADLVVSGLTTTPDKLPNVAHTQKEPLVIKLYTDDPDVIIYWISEGEGDSQ